MKIAAEANMMITEMEDILKASINNRLINATNITGVSKDLQHLIQSDMENWVFQIQQMLADELDVYKERMLDVVCTWGWKSMELAQTCTGCRNSCNELGDADLSERPWPQLMCCASYKPHGYNFREWSCMEL